MYATHNITESTLWEPVITENDRQMIYTDLKEGFMSLGVNLDAFLSPADGSVHSYEVQLSRNFPDIKTIHIAGKKGQRFTFERIPIGILPKSAAPEKPTNYNLLVHEENIIPLDGNQYYWERSSFCVEFNRYSNPLYAGLSSTIAQVDGNSLPIKLNDHLPSKFISTHPSSPLILESICGKSSKFERSGDTWYLTKHSDSTGKTLREHPVYSQQLSFWEVRDLSGIVFP